MFSRIVIEAPIRVKVVYPANETGIVVEIDRFDTGHTLKKRIYEQIGIPENQQKISFNGEELTDSEIVGKRHVSDGDTIDLLPLLRGGTFNVQSLYPSVEFPNIDSGVKIQTIEWSKAPPWRKWGKGMSVEVVCQRRKCEWREKKAIVTLGFPKKPYYFDIADVGCDARCKKCKGKIVDGNITRWGFSRCIFWIVTVDGKVGRKSSKKITAGNSANFIANGKVKSYRSVRIFVKRLKHERGPFGKLVRLFN